VRLYRITVLRSLQFTDAQAEPAPIGAAKAAWWDVKGRAAAEEARRRQGRLAGLRNNFTTQPPTKNVAVQTDGTGGDADEGHRDAGPIGNGGRPAAADGAEPLRRREQAAAVQWLPEPHGWQLAPAASMSTSSGSTSPQVNCCAECSPVDHKAGIQGSSGPATLHDKHEESSVRE